MRWIVLSLIMMGAALSAGAVDTSVPKREYRELTAGRYSLKVSGLLCYTCTRAVARELEKLAEVQSVKGDFENEQIILEIKLDRTLPVAAVRRALARASKRVDLATKFDVVGVQYLP